MIELSPIEFPYIETNKSRHGLIRYYFRFDGKRVRLPDDYGSEEFIKEYWAARTSIIAPQEANTGPKPLSSLVKPNSFRWLCMEYMRSSEFTRLDTTTRNRRRAILEAIWIEPLTKTSDKLFADIPIEKMNSSHIEVLRDRKQDVPFAADERLKVLRQVFETKQNGKAICANIAKAVRPFNVATTGHHTILPEEIGQYIKHHGTRSKAVLAIALLMYTGIRVSDLALIGPQHRRGSMFQLRLFKNRNRKPVEIRIEIHPILDAVLKMHNFKSMNYMTTEFDKPFSIKGLGNRVSDWFRQAGLPHCTAHSVRKGLATDQANNGATDNMLEAMFGWTDGKTSKIYTRNADRAKLARMAVLQIDWEGFGNILLHQNLDESPHRLTSEI